MMHRLLTLAILLTALPAVACNQPFSVFQNGPNAILELQMSEAMGTALSDKEQEMLTRYTADSSTYWALKTQYEPVCSDVADPNNCISECKNRPAEAVQAATVKEGSLRYSLTADKRAELKKQAAELESRWNQMEYVK